MRVETQWFLCGVLCWFAGACHESRPVDEAADPAADTGQMASPSDSDGFQQESDAPATASEDATASEADTASDDQQETDYWVTGRCPAQLGAEEVVASTECRGIDYTGCCAGDTVLYCAQDTLYCARCAHACSWYWDAQRATSYYWCTAEDNGPDPSGAAPLSCDTVLQGGQVEPTRDYWIDGYCPPGENKVSEECRGIDYQGTCDDNGNAVFCANGDLYCRRCEATEVCAWFTGDPNPDHGDYYWCVPYDIVIIP